MREAWDVIVAGGGVSGCMAAIAAARNGARTLLVERYGFLGGTLTNAGVGPMMTFHAGERQVVRGIAQEVVDRLTEAGGCLGHIEDTTGYASSITPFDAETLKWVLDEMTAEAGCQVLFHTRLCGARVEKGRIAALSLLGKGGKLPVEGRSFVDATGDADLAFLAGAETVAGRDADALCQPMTLNMKIAGVDVQALKDAVTREPDNFNIRDLTALDRSPRLALAGFYRQHRKAKAEGRLSTGRADVLMFETVNPGEFILNATRVIRLSAVDPWELSQAEREGRKQARELYDFVKREADGFQNATLISTGVQIGVRESRRVMGEYLLTKEDLLASRRFEDTVALGGYPIDIHDPAGEKTHTTHLKRGQYYSIPYRTLAAKGIENLLVSGRCISVTHEAGAAIRVTPIAMATGQAAGTAAALCGLGGMAAREVDVSALQALLEKQGAVLK